MNFEMEMLQDDERKEIHRILRALTQQIRRFLPDLRSYHKVLVELDWARAKAQLAREMDADLPGIRTDENFHLIQAYHPLLAMQNAAKGLHTEPQTLQLQRKERMLVISGPNAGGKSITLKTVGLLQVMLQSGLLIPAHPNSEMGCFRAILTDIGDNQSIENQLSTYSYRLNRMKGFLDVADRSSLLLLDEFGTGSDPELGGALAEVFLKSCTNAASSQSSPPTMPTSRPAPLNCPKPSTARCGLTRNPFSHCSSWTSALRAVHSRSRWHTSTVSTTPSSNVQRANWITARSNWTS